MPQMSLSVKAAMLNARPQGSHLIVLPVAGIFWLDYKSYGGAACGRSKRVHSISRAAFSVGRLNQGKQYLQAVAEVRATRTKA